MNNLVVQLLLKTGTFSTDLKTARGQIQNFQQGCQTAGRSLSGFGQALGINVGALTKFGGAVGAAVVAGKALKGILDSTQTTSDAFQNAIAGCKGVVESFSRAIALSDFSAFSNGIWDIVDAAKAARQALDDLQDAYAFYGLLSSENRTKFMTAQEGFRNPNNTPEQKQQYLKDAEDAVKEGFELVSGLEQKTLDNFRAQVQNWAGKANVELQDINFDQLKTVAKEFLKDSEAAVNKYKTGYNDFISDRNQFKVPWYKKQNKKLFAPDEFNNTVTVSDLTRKNKDFVVGRAILEMKDEDRNALIESISRIDAATQSVKSQEMSLDRMRKQDLKTNNTTNTTTTTTNGLKDEIPVLKESRESWVRLRTEAEKYRNGQVYDSKKWNEYNDIVREAIQNIQELDEKENARNNRRDIEESGLMDKLPELPKIEGKAEIGPDPKTVKYTATELDHLIKLYTQWKDELEEGDPLIAKYNQKIKEYGDRLNVINSTGLPEPSIKKETINTWDEFNSAMANTSTIVSSLSNTFKKSSEVTVASILQMVSTALPAIGSLISSIQALSAAEAVEAGVAATGKAVSTSKHWIEAIAAVAALGAAVATAISAAQKPQRFANGGIVGGSSFTGDRVSAQVNSGEMILNKTQQARLFQIANGSVTEEREVNFRISGTDLVGVLNNQTRKNRLIR